MPSPPRNAYVANLIPSLQARGLSATAALEELKAAGMGIRRQNFLRLWGSTARSEALREQMGSVDLTRMPFASEIVQMERPKARGYQYNVDVLMRDEKSGVHYFTPSAVVSDTLLSYQDAIARASQVLRDVQQLANRDSFPGEIFYGGHVTAIIERVPEGMGD